LRYSNRGRKSACGSSAVSSELKSVDGSADSISVDMFSFSGMGLKMDRKRESAKDFIHALLVLTHLYHFSRGQQSLSKFIQIPLVYLLKPTDERLSPTITLMLIDLIGLPVGRIRSGASSKTSS
jgi:hypothetical protein